jgi:hypothetical protein
MEVGRWKRRGGREDATVELAHPQVYPSNIAQGMRVKRENLCRVAGQHQGNENHETLVKKRLNCIYDQEVRNTAVKICKHELSNVRHGK